MADLFLSYARADSRAFVARLSAALEERGKETWVDLDDIPAASVWNDDLRAGIASSDSFCFVISPASVASEHCRDRAGLRRGPRQAAAAGAAPPSAGRRGARGSRQSGTGSLRPAGSTTTSTEPWPRSSPRSRPTSTGSASTPAGDCVPTEWEAPWRGPQPAGPRLRPRPGRGLPVGGGGNREPQPTELQGRYVAGLAPRRVASPAAAGHRCLDRPRGRDRARRPGAAAAEHRRRAAPRGRHPATQGRDRARRSDLARPGGQRVPQPADRPRAEPPARDSRRRRRARRPRPRRHCAAPCSAPRLRLHLDHGGAVNSASYSPDGSRIVTSERGPERRTLGRSVRRPDRRCSRAHTQPVAEGDVERRREPRRHRSRRTRPPGSTTEPPVQPISRHHRPGRPSPD